MVQRVFRFFFYGSGLLFIVAYQWLNASLTTDCFTTVTSLFYFWYSVISFNDAYSSLASCSWATMTLRLYSMLLIAYAATSYLLLILYVIDPDSAWFVSSGTIMFNSASYYGREVFERLSPTEINNETSHSRQSTREWLIYCYQLFRDQL